MSQITQKDYYSILGIPNTASQVQIEAAYQKLAAENHPQKHPQDRVKAQQRFNQICQAYFNLSNPERRNHYDQLRIKKFDAEAAAKTFEKFFDQHGINDEDEKQFFSKNYPEKKKNYYQILGVNKNARLEDINNAYRKLALKYHPKNNPDKDAQEKFIAINEAYYNLSDKNKRRQYDQYTFDNFRNSHSVFENFFGNRSFLLEDDNKFFSPFLNRIPINNFMEIEDDSESQNYNRNNSITGKTVIQKTEIKNGKRVYTKNQQILNSDGTRSITETINDGKGTRTKKYHLAAGQQRPKQLRL